MTSASNLLTVFAGLYSQADTPSFVSRDISIGKYPLGNATIVCMLVQCTVPAWTDSQSMHGMQTSFGMIATVPGQRSITCMRYILKILL